MTITYEKRWSIIRYKKDQWSNKAIRKKLDINNHTLLKWWNRYQQTGDVRRVDNQGRARVTTTATDNEIVSLVKEQPEKTSSKLQQQINSSNKSPSTRTVRRRLREGGGNYSFPKKAPHLTLKNKEKRLQWCKKSHNHDFNKTIFSDEKVFYLNKRDGRVWILPGGNNQRKTTKSTVKMNVWGAITRYEKSNLCHITSNINAIKYQEVLKKNMLPFYHHVAKEGVWWFQQDGAPPHTAKSTINFLQSRRIKVIEWPPQSPDLNPIENL